MTKQIFVVVAFLVCVVLTDVVAAEERDQQVKQGFGVALGKAVVAASWNPTTYVAPVMNRRARGRDWKTSWDLFRDGRYGLEANPKFTESGRPYDTPLSYEEGMTKINRDAIGLAFQTYGLNVVSELGAEYLKRQNPDHKRMVTVVKYVFQATLQSYIAHQKSAMHNRQAEINEALARQLGIR